MEIKSDSEGRLSADEATNSDQHDDASMSRKTARGLVWLSGRLIFVVVAVTSFMVTPAHAAETPPLVLFSVALLTGVLGFVGSWIGAQVALSNFKKQRAFDKQLEWYERAVSAILAMGEKIVIAVNAEDNNLSAKKREAEWREVQLAHRAIDRVALEAPLYASDSAVAEIKEIQKKVQAVAQKTEAFDPPSFPENSDRYQLLRKIYKLGEDLEKGSPVLLKEGRLHLSSSRFNLR